LVSFHGECGHEKLFISVEEMPYFSTHLFRSLKSF
jgi:hypothetical protein